MTDRPRGFPAPGPRPCHPVGWVVLGITALAAALASGCGAAKVREPCRSGATVHLRVAAGQDLNLAGDGRSLSTQLRLFQLRDLRGADEASFDDLWRRSEETLGSSLVASDSVTLRPGTVLRAHFERGRDVRHVVVMAVFRQPEGKHWRVILDLPPPDDACLGEARPDSSVQTLDPHLELFAEFSRLHGMVSMERSGARR